MVETVVLTTSPSDAVTAQVRTLNYLPANAIVVSAFTEKKLLCAAAVNCDEASFDTFINIANVLKEHPVTRVDIIYYAQPDENRAYLIDFLARRIFNPYAARLFFVHQEQVWTCHNTTIGTPEPLNRDNMAGADVDRAQQVALVTQEREPHTPQETDPETALERFLELFNGSPLTPQDAATAARICRENPDIHSVIAGIPARFCQLQQAALMRKHCHPDDLLPVLLLMVMLSYQLQEQLLLIETIRQISDHAPGLADKLYRLCIEKRR